MLTKRLTAIAAVAMAYMASTPAFAGDPNTVYSLGVEGFYDNYKEPDATVNNKAYDGSITGSVSHDWNHFFAALDGRITYGENDYKSDSGSANGIPEWEFEARPRVGFSMHMIGGTLSPYVGFGVRYFRDDNKGVTTTNAQGESFFGYDRRIIQLYVPIGATYAFQTSSGWTIAPNLEYDHLLWGQVSSRLGNGGEGFDQSGNFIQNVNSVVEQEDGWGARGSLMFGKQEGNWSWQAGPFFRYWDIKASNAAVGQFITTPSNTTEVVLFDEPRNTRLQAGVQARILW